MNRTVRGLAVAMLAVAFAGCGAAAATKVATPAPNATATEVQTVAPTDTPTLPPTAKPTAQPATPKPAPTGYKLVTDAKVGYSFAVPSAWQVLSEADVAAMESAWKTIESQNPERAAALEQSYQALKSGAVAALVFDVAPSSDGFTTNLNLVVQPRPAIIDLDAASKLFTTELETSLKLPAGSVAASRVTVPAGDALMFNYEMTITGAAGKITIHGLQYVVLTPDHMFMLALSSSAKTFAATEPTFKKIVESLESI